MPAHPRAGGENEATVDAADRERGSSPRGRGKHGISPSLRFGERLIPARAGKTLRRCSGSRNRAAHPRAGGENPTAASSRRARAGSSPRGRGKLAGGPCLGGGCGLIPARAGKTSLLRTYLMRSRAHPRAGGENGQRRPRCTSDLGSSPRGRGKRSTRCPRREWRGLIPARAGKTERGSSPLYASSAHPRAGGENDRVRHAGPSRHGSSPRGRGKRPCHCTQRVVRGLIPARAGKTGLRCARS